MFKASLISSTFHIFIFSNASIFISISGIVLSFTFFFKVIKACYCLLLYVSAIYGCILSFKSFYTGWNCVIYIIVLLIIVNICLVSFKTPTFNMSHVTEELKFYLSHCVCQLICIWIAYKGLLHHPHLLFLCNWCTFLVFRLFLFLIL